jgi:RES domain-containing protein
LKIEAPDDVQVEYVSVDDLPANWPEKIEVTRELGDRWLVKGSAALLGVPSAIVPETLNVLLNPTHEDARRIVIVRTGGHAIDPRLLKQARALNNL